MNKKYAFTLSEVMVTVAVLGVLAAVLIPAVTKVKPDSNKIMYRKAYSTIEKVVSEMINDEQAYPADITGTTTDTLRLVSKGFNDQTKTDLGIAAGDDKFCVLFTRHANLVGSETCSTSGEHVIDDYVKLFTTTDGVIWYMEDLPADFPLSDASFKAIAIDLNGSKTPNCGYWGPTSCSGSTTPDRYSFGIRYDGKIKPMDAGSDYLLDPTKNN